MGPYLGWRRYIKSYSQNATQFMIQRCRLFVSSMSSAPGNVIIIIITIISIKTSTASLLTRKPPSLRTTTQDSAHLSPAESAR